MTVKIQDLTIRQADDAWLSAAEVGGVTMVNTPHYFGVILGMVRHIMRDERCTMIPRVTAAVAHPVNKYGHNVEVEVAYDRDHGWRAIFAGHYDPNTRTLSNVTCYMD